MQSRYIVKEERISQSEARYTIITTKSVLLPRVCGEITLKVLLNILPILAAAARM